MMNLNMKWILIDITAKCIHNYLFSSVNIEDYLSYHKRNFDKNNDNLFKSGNFNFLFELIFELDYHHSLIVGSYLLDQGKLIISLIVDKIFTNSENVFDPKIDLIKMKLGHNKLSFENECFINKLFKTERMLELNLHTNYKNKLI